MQSARKKMLFIINSIPFPPRNGMELPTSKIIEKLAEQYSVSLLVVVSNTEQEYHQRVQHVPAHISNTYMIKAGRRSSISKFVLEWLGIKPSFFYPHVRSQDLEPQLSGADFDLVWLSPFRCISVLRDLQRVGVVSVNKVAVGLNDVKTYMYRDSLKEFLSGRLGLDFSRLYRGIRTWLMYMYERRYLRNVDMIHVQTAREREKAYRILGGFGQGINIVSAPNGRKQELVEVEYQGIDSNKVLYMTHLSGERARESRWFISQVWPLVINQVPEARLLLVGSPPPADSPLAANLPDSVSILGYVDDLQALYASVAIAVVPTLHSTGLINRIQDALVAGIPVVATPEALSTIDCIQQGVHAISAQDSESFANAVTGLLQNREERLRLSREAKVFSQSMSTWDETTSTILKQLEGL
jgi:glycosyltransferase involved in cell wall biosynthesis